jgi:hypothetical protein
MYGQAVSIISVGTAEMTGKQQLLEDIQLMSQKHRTLN